MNATSNALTENDVIFGLRDSKNDDKNNLATKRLDDIVQEKVQAHREADREGRRKIEWSIVKQLQKELPSGSRFVKFCHSSEQGSNYFHMMTDQEARQAIAGMYSHLHSCHASSEPGDTETSSTRASKIQERATNDDVESENSCQPRLESSALEINNANESDVVFGYVGCSTSVGTMKLRKIVKENFEAYRGADRYERRNMERAVITQVKEILPPDARFLRVFPGKGTQKDVFTLVTSSDLPKEVKLVFTGKLKYAKAKEKKATVRARIRQPQVPYADGNIPHHPIQEANSIGVELNDSADQRASKQLNDASTSQEEPPAETNNEHSDPTSSICSTATKRSTEGSHTASNKKARVASLQTTDSSEPTMIMIKQEPVERNDEDLDAVDEPPSDPQFDLSGIIIKEEPVDQNQELATLMNIKSNLEAMCEIFQSKNAKLKRKIADLQQNRIPASELERLQIENAELKQKIAVFKQKIAELEKEPGVAGAGLEESLREYCIAES